MQNTILASELVRLMKSSIQTLSSDLGRLIRASRARERFALLRIHKTASQSFRAAFRNCYQNKDDARLNFASDVCLDKIMAKRFVSPHMSVQQWLNLEAEKDWKIGVTLRAPRNRLRSAFLYFRTKPDSNPTGVGSLLRQMNYLSFLQSDNPVTIGLKDNIITKFIGGGSFGSAATERNQVNLPATISLDEAKSLAFERLSSNLVTPLIIEHVELSIQKTSMILGVTRQPKVGWVNRNRNKNITDYSDEIIDLENKFLKHDFEVYDCAINKLKSN